MSLKHTRDIEESVPMKSLFELSRYLNRLPSYRRVKRRVIFNHTSLIRLNPIEIRKNLNRYNSGDNNFRSVDESSLEALDLPL